MPKVLQDSMIKHELSESPSPKSSSDDDDEEDIQEKRSRRSKKRGQDDGDSPDSPLDDEDGDSSHSITVTTFNKGTKRTEVMTLPLPPGTLPPRKRAKTKDEKEQRRIERIMRNRQAAHASREKKRRHLEELEQKCVELTRENDMLRKGSGSIHCDTTAPSAESLETPKLVEQIEELKSIINLARSTKDLKHLDRIDDMFNAHVGTPPKYETDVKDGYTSPASLVLSTFTPSLSSSVSNSPLNYASSVEDLVPGYSLKHDEDDFLGGVFENKVLKHGEDSITDQGLLLSGARWSHHSAEMMGTEDQQRLWLILSMALLMAVPQSILMNLENSPPVELLSRRKKTISPREVCI